MEMEHNEKKIIEFPKGLPGFEEKAFFFSEEKDTPLAQLDSIECKEIGFILLRPQLFFADYLQKVDLLTEEVELLELGENEQVDVWAIMTLCLSDMSKATVNLRAPLLINPKAKKGLQIILNDEGYPFRQRLFVGETNSTTVESTREGAVG